MNREGALELVNADLEGDRCMDDRRRDARSLREAMALGFDG